MKNQYNKIAPLYDEHRQNIGLQTISTWVEQFHFKSILDLGCGTGKPIAINIAPKVTNYIGVDSSSEMLKFFSKAVPSAVNILSDLESLDLSGTDFDFIFSWGSLCHLEPNAQKTTILLAIKQLQPKGIFLFTNSPSKGSCQGNIGPHIVQHFSLGIETYDKLFLDNGFEILFQGETEAENFTYVYQKK